MTRDEYIALIRSDVRDTALKLTDPDDWDAALNDALARYSVLRPRILTEAIAGDNGTAYPLPDDFSLGFSTILALGESSDAIAVDEPLDPEEYEIVHAVAGGAVLVLDDALLTGETLYLTFTATHPTDDVTDTVAPADSLAVVKYGAAFACLKLAAHYAQTSEPTLGADVINYGDRAATYARLSQEYRQTANRHFGISDDEPEVQAASAALELPQMLLGGQPRFFHP